MTKLRYEEFEYLSRAEIETCLASGEAEKIRGALNSASKHDPDWRWSQNQCLRFLDHPDHEVKWAAILARGFIAVYQKNLDLAEVLPRLHEIHEDPLVGRVAEDSIEMVLRFVRPQ
jgi:hypothetical protein